MILLEILRQQAHQTGFYRLCSTCLLRSQLKTSLIAQNKSIFTNNRNENLRSLLSSDFPILIKQQNRKTKLKFSFGYTNYGHRRHIRPPGHHVVHYLQFVFVIIGAYAIFFLTFEETIDNIFMQINFRNVTEFEDRWNQPINSNPMSEMNTYVNENEVQKRLEIFSNVKASNNLTDATINNSNQDLSQLIEKDEKKEMKSKTSFRDKKKISYENRIRSYSTPDKIFRYFATLKVYNDENPDGIICMTPDDFLRSITPGIKQPDGLELDKYNRYDSRTDSLEKLEYLNQNINRNEISIFERIGGKQCLITYSDFIFLLTLLSTPRRYFEIAFKMFDLDGNGNFDFDEFIKLKNLIRQQTTIGQKHRDHSTTGNILKENSILNKFFFGENLDQLLSIDRFLSFYDQLQYDILLLEFSRSNKSLSNSNNITEADFANLLLTYSGLSDKSIKKIIKRIKKSYPIDDPTKSKGISLNDYKNFNDFLRNIHDIDIALTFYHIAGGSIDKQIFRHVAKIVNRVDLDQHLIDVVFMIFDCNQDQLLSYLEFIQLMKNRLERGLQKPKDTAFIKLFSTAITCAKQTYL